MGRRKILEGKVISNATDKTIIVETTGKSLYHLYKRMVVRRKKYAVHDENNEAKVKDKVRIIESRPYSKRKHFKLLEIIKK